MELTLYQIDAFARQVFEGNPAAVCPLQAWLPDEVMQNIAAENNLSETAFFVASDKGYHIRWFTPVHEVELCGHATLASAYVLFELLDYDGDRLVFDSRSGPLTVYRENDWLSMDFPSQPPRACDIPETLLRAFEFQPIACLKAVDYILVFKDQRTIENCRPDLVMLAELDCRGVAITARGEQHDFVSRFFAPRYGINEDPVTGSAFTQLIPYWATELDKTELRARQISHRGGDVLCRMQGDRVSIAGQAVKYMQASIEI